MSGKYVFLVISCVILSAHSYRLNNKVCEGSLCLYLYEIVSSRVTWDTSRTACTDEGLEMLRIVSSQTQTMVDRLLQDLPQNTQREVWIGGRGSSDDTWRYMNGTEFHRPVSDNSASDLNCVHVKLCNDANPEYFADNCDEKKSTSGVLCQYDKSETGECRQSDYQFGDKCYAKTPYDGSEPNRTDWYSGQTYCSQSPIRGDIAYSYLDDNNYINSVRYLVDDNDDCAILWLGVRRRIWFWRTVSDSDEQSIKYFNWFYGTQIQPSYGNCIYVDRDNGNKWRTQSCYTYLRYFVCMKGTTPTTTITTATTFTSDVTDKITTHLDNNHTTLTVCDNSQLLNNYKIAFISTLLICFVLLVGLAATLIRYWTRMSRQSSSSSQTELSSGDVTHTLATRSLPLPDSETSTSDLREQNNGQVEYEQVTGQDGQGHAVETEVNPYEKPSTYINMVDRPNTYDALKK